ncbi:hypothetical protein PENSPDRAFT_695382, partial [Peniophora sp. CONT]
MASNSDDVIFSGDWLGPEKPRGRTDRSTHADPSFSSGQESTPSRTRTPAPRSLAYKEYGTRDWVGVPVTADASLLPPANLARIAGPSGDFESWLEGLQAVSTLDHPTERRLRVARDARLLSALRRCHSTHLNHLRRLGDARMLAVHILRSPFIRRISEAQGVDLKIRPDSNKDAQLLAACDGDNNPVFSDDEFDSSEISMS